MNISQKVAMAGVIRELGEERERQHEKWGEQNHPDGTGADFAAMARVNRDICDHDFRKGDGTYRHILLEEVYEALAESDHSALRKELIQVAAVCVAWVETIDRRPRPPETGREP